MNSETPSFQTIDEYIALYQGDIQARLITLRETIRAAAPEATERISYRMPTFFLRGDLVYFAAFKNHIGFFPTSSGVAAFQDELAGYTVTTGTIHLPHDQPLPLDLITRIVTYRVNENRNRPTKRAHKPTEKS